MQVWLPSSSHIARYHLPNALPGTFWEPTFSAHIVLWARSFSHTRSKYKTVFICEDAPFVFQTWVTLYTTFCVDMHIFLLRLKADCFTLLFTVP